MSNKRGPGNHLKGPQADYLRSYYLTNQKPSKEERDAIAAEIGVEAKTIAVRVFVDKMANLLQTSFSYTCESKCLVIAK